MSTLGEIDEKALVSLVVELIEHDPEVRSAVMRLANNTPGIITTY